MDKQSLINVARNVLLTEIEGLNSVVAGLSDSFADAANTINASNGRLIVSGIGKSAIIAQKIVATLNSTGTPSIFMHAADALHGDLGNIQQDDVVLIISNSGNSPEILALIPMIKNLGNALLAFTGNSQSELAKKADCVLLTAVEKEACDIVAAPTSSTTAQMALGDALAVSLMQLKGFTESDFARNHPGGALGKKLYLKVSDLCGEKSSPTVSPDATLNEVIVNITNHRLGATVLIENTQIKGIITDGDIRRLLSKEADIYQLKAADIASKNPKTIDSEELAVNALQLMESHKVTQLIVTRRDNYFGLIHLHDLLKEGIL